MDGPGWRAHLNKSVLTYVPCREGRVAKKTHNAKWLSKETLDPIEKKYRFGVVADTAVGELASSKHCREKGEGCWLSQRRRPRTFENFWPNQNVYCVTKKRASNTVPSRLIEPGESQFPKPGYRVFSDTTQRDDTRTLLSTALRTTSASTPIPTVEKHGGEAFMLWGCFSSSRYSETEQQVLKNHLENLSFLTKVGSKIREKNVHAKLGDNREECISHALHAKGITTDNPKVAVTDNFLCTGGRTPFRDHIACSGDSGGAVFKNYEHRTIQVGLVSWGTHDLCKLEEVAESTDISRDFHVNLFRVVPFLKSVLANDAQDDFAPLQFLEN
ncbi:unnamed protein product [Pleuronectes platessa]|uniref:Peptidase S1 domain-containing protein n=1 Tax=Pleuronectes platessa TaxID=8262 RepID=A0A9N7V4G9_PLEPL|nr:unnamed protein product [Pleuronectes platessa]